MSAVTDIREGGLESRATLAHPQDVAYQMERRKRINTLMRYTVPELQRMLSIAQHQPAPADPDGVGRTLLKGSMVPDSVKNILGTTSGSGESDGSALVRQDLEPIIYAYENCAFAA